MAASMLLRDVIQKTTQFFRDKGFDSPRLDTELLLAKALNWDRLKLYLNYEYPLNDRELSEARELVRRRLAGEPVAYILGTRDFYNHSFAVTPAVLIPRPETETIVHEVITWRKTLTKSEGEAFRIVDLGTGSGCIGLSLLAEIADATLLAVDVSAEALAVAQSNAERLGVDERAQLRLCDASALTGPELVAALGGLADAVVANPPYIAQEDPEVDASVKSFEPSGALFSGVDGLDHVRAWAKRAGELAKPGALVMFEIGYRQGEQAREIFEACGTYRQIEVVPDLSGKDRFIRCYRI